MDSIRFVAAARGEEETRSSRSSYAKPHSDRLVVTTRDFTMCVQRESFFFVFLQQLPLDAFFFLTSFEWESDLICLMKNFHIF